MEDKLDSILDRLTAIEDRLTRLESALERERVLADRLRHETEARRDLGDQVQYLVDWLGEARNEVQWLKSQRPS